MDGIGWFTYETFRRICKDHPEHEFHFLFDRPFSEKFVFADNVVPHVVHPQARHPWLYRIWYDYTVPLKLKRIKADVFISPDAMISLRTSIPQMIVMHDLNFVHYPQDLSRILSNYLQSGSRRYAEIATRIVTVSEYSKQDIIDQYSVPKDIVDNVYNGVNENYMPISDEQKLSVRKRISGGAPYFLFVGSAYPRKNLQRLIPAFDLFKIKTGSDAKLVVVGKKFTGYKEVNAAIDSMKFKNDLIFTGMLDANVLHEVIASALALTYVSYFEGFGIPILEAFKCDVPVITSNVTSMPEVAGNAALFVDPFSVDSIANALMKVNQNEGLREELILKGRARASHFSWDKTAEKLWQSIEKMIR